MVARGKARGTWALTPKGRAHSEDLVKDLDLAALTAEAAATGGTTLGGAVHPTIPPSLAPPGLVLALRQFLDSHPFERNVFAMTRFPDEPLRLRLILWPRRSRCPARYAESMD
jgi:DNA-binding transcriptional LysR family regulator